MRAVDVSLTTRVLPPGEWSRLAGTDTAAILPYVTPDSLEIVVLEDGDRVVGACSRWLVPHLEGLWIAPAYRGPRAVRQLVRAAIGSLSWFMTSALHPRTRRRLERVGAWRWPGDAFIVGTEAVCRRLQG